MDILALLGIEQQIKRAKKESPQERYARIDIDLADPEYIGKNIEVKITGDYLSRISYNGTATGCYFKFDSKHSSILYASEFKKRKTPFTEFKKIYLTNPVAQTGKHFILLVGSWYNGEIEPTPGITVGELDKDGSNLDPVTSQRFLYELTKHTVDLAALEVLQTATETSLDAILAKIIVAPATETSVAGIRTAVEKIDDWEDSQHVDVPKNVPIEMLSDVLVVTGDAATDTIAAPAAGHHLEVYGYQITEHANSAGLLSAAPKLEFVTSSIGLWHGSQDTPPANTISMVGVSNIRISGASEEALTLTNCDITAGTSWKITATIFYQVVDD